MTRLAKIPAGGFVFNPLELEGASAGLLDVLASPPVGRDVDPLVVMLIQLSCS
ncbi:MAG: hypothetical protein QE493_08045 [Verrucomicrobiae bacterium]|nr:hypothetical protein [Verrucomicrobiae bacterium]